MDIQSHCLFCNNSDNLNTMQIKFSGKSWIIALCEEHEESSFREMKIQIARIIKAVDFIKDDLVDFSSKCMFCDIINNLNNMIIKINNKKYEVALCEDHEDNSIKIIKEKVIKLINDPLDTIDISRFGEFWKKSKLEPEEKIKNTKDTKEIKDIREIRPNVIERVSETHQGVPITIPKMIHDATGTTHIQVVKKDDNWMQKRFKRACQTENTQDMPKYSNVCPACQDTQIVNGGPCPICG